MSWVEDLQKEAEEIFSEKWDVRNGNVIPDTDNVALGDGAVRIDAAFLYADLADSSGLAKHCPWHTTGKILRAYLSSATRLIKAYQGEIKSFDGDRVMGVFHGDSQVVQAVKCAREIDWVVENIIGPAAMEKFLSIKNNAIRIRHCVGIDTGSAVAVRAGIRNNNDLIWIGRAPSFAAKLSDIRNYPYCVYITKACFDALPSGQRTSDDGTLIWESRSYKFADEVEPIYRTKYVRIP